MKSKVIELFDYKSLTIPHELCLWHMPDEELDTQLKTLSHAHAYEEEVDTVESGDSVACRGESAISRWKRETLLFYPGHCLCEKTLEDGLLGMHFGETKVLQTSEGEVSLTVKRIIRRKDMPIGDELVRCEHIEGVNTLAAYARWFRSKQESFYRLRAQYQCAKYLLDEVEKRSVLYIDPEERDASIWQRVNCIYDAMVAAGMDPTVPEEGIEFLTEEQAKEKMFREYSWTFPAYVVQARMAEMLSGRTIEDITEEGLKKLSEETNMSVDDIRKSSAESMILAKFALEKAIELLGQYTKQFLEA